MRHLYLRNRFFSVLTKNHIRNDVFLIIKYTYFPLVLDTDRFVRLSRRETQRNLINFNCALIRNEQISCLIALWEWTIIQSRPCNYI